MRCEVCHAVVLTLDEERTPHEVTRVDPQTKAVKTYTVRCCSMCLSHLGENNTEERRRT